VSTPKCPPHVKYIEYVKHIEYTLDNVYKRLQRFRLDDFGSLSSCVDVRGLECLLKYLDTKDLGNRGDA
jgi:hypothetical protein